ncbi:MAG TPA: hypothetical protein ENO08_00425, partial [Candidatus Eisenbacteria bacterium]|nr:hypothetical protein [Candidatus Eisenbacteria bacterium]
MRAMNGCRAFTIALAMLLFQAAPPAAREGGSAGMRAREAPGAERRTVTDMLGRRVSIPAAVERLVGIEAGALR